MQKSVLKVSQMGFDQNCYKNIVILDSFRIQSILIVLLHQKLSILLFTNLKYPFLPDNNSNIILLIFFFCIRLEIKTLLPRENIITSFVFFLFCFFFVNFFRIIFCILLLLCNFPSQNNTFYTFLNHIIIPD